MRNKVRAAIEHIGRPVTVTSTGAPPITLTAVIQPDFSRETPLPGELGHGNALRYQLHTAYGQHTHALLVGSVVSFPNFTFAVDRVDDYFIGTQLIYRKARLVLLRGDYYDTATT